MSQVTTDNANKLVEAAVKSSDERLKQARFYRRNACTRHGVLYEDDAPAPVSFEHHHRHDHRNDPPAPQEPHPAQGTPRSPWWKSTPAQLVGGALIGSGLTLPWMFAFGEKDEQPVPPADSSLLQYLEDQGYHVPQ